jgi:hypothetical protein
VLVTGAVVMVIALPSMGVARGAGCGSCAMLAYVFVDVLVDISMNLQGSWISARRHTPVMNRLHGTWSLGAFTGGSAPRRRTPPVGRCRSTSPS